MPTTVSTSTVANGCGVGNTGGGTQSTAQGLVVANNGDILFVWFDGTNVKWSYASVSDYTTWTTATLISSLGSGPRVQYGVLYDGTNDQAIIVTSNAAGNMVSYIATHNASSHHFSMGAANTVLAAGSAYNGNQVCMDIDAQGRYWVAWMNNSATAEVYYSANGTSWTASTTQAVVGGFGVMGLAYCGNYVVITFCNASGVWQYRYVDAHSATIGSWSAAAAITNNTMDNTVSSFMFKAAAPSSNHGVLMGQMGGMIAQYFDASTVAWSTLTTLDSSTNSDYPNMASDGTNLYCIWSKYAAANSFSLSYKVFTDSTHTFDTSPTTLEASGANNQYVSCDINNSTLGFVYMTGTATPWNVVFDSKSLGGGTTPITVSDSATGSEAIVIGLPLSDAASASESLAISVAFSLATSGAGSESIASTTTASIADSATGSESIVIGKPIGDAAVGSESVPIAVTLPLNDSAAGSDNLTIVASFTKVDPATGAESNSIHAAFTVSDTATGSELKAVTATIPLSDSGAGSDSISGLDPGTPITVTDSATGVETIAMAIIRPAIIDSAIGATSLAVQSTLTITDSGIAAESLASTTSFSLVDTGAGTDSVSVAGGGIVTVNDTASGHDTVVLSTIQVALNDAAASAEQLTANVTFTKTDPATGVDTAAINPNINLTDMASGSDTVGMHPITVTLLDSGTGATVQSFGVVTVVRTDTGAGGDSVTVLDTSTYDKAIGDSAVGTDTIIRTIVIAAAPVIINSFTESQLIFGPSDVAIIIL